MNGLRCFNINCMSQTTLGCVNPLLPHYIAWQTVNGVHFECLGHVKCDKIRDLLKIIIWPNTDILCFCIIGFATFYQQTFCHRSQSSIEGTRQTHKIYVNCEINQRYFPKQTIHLLLFLPFIWNNYFKNPVKRNLIKAHLSQLYRVSTKSRYHCNSPFSKTTWHRAIRFSVKCSISFQVMIQCTSVCNSLVAQRISRCYSNSLHTRRNISTGIVCIASIIRLRSITRSWTGIW